MMKTLNFLKIITILNVVVATGFSLAGLLNPALILPTKISAEKAISIFAMYAAARTIPLAVITIFTLISKSNNLLISLAVMTGLVQFLDGFIGIYQGEISKSAGPFIIAIIQFIAIYFLIRDKYSVLGNG